MTTLTFLQVRTLEIAARELYAALKHRDRCEGCGGQGWTWVDVGGEAEADPCSCTWEANEMLEKYKHLDTEDDDHG